jgi:hypothetical protein
MTSVGEIATRANRLIASDRILPTAMLVLLGSAFALAPAPVLRTWRGPPLEWRNFYVIVTGLIIVWSALT